MDTHNDNMIEFSHTHQIRVRYVDTDKMGIVYNGNYFSFFEVGRTELMRHHGFPYLALEEEGFYLPLVESYAKYIASAQYDDLIDVGTTLYFENRATVRFEYNIFLNGSPLTTGYTVHSFMDKKTGRTTRPPKAFKDAVTTIYKKINSK